MRIITAIALFVLPVLMSQGQTDVKQKNGKISYQSSENIYVTFESTEGMKVGDTIFVAGNGSMKPVMVIKNLSSISCVCEKLPGYDPKVSDKVVYRSPKDRINPAGQQKKEDPDANTKPLKKETKSKPAKNTSDKKNITDNTANQQEGSKVYGRLSVSTYSDFSDLDEENNQRMRYVLSLNTDNISNSPVSFSSYIAFNYSQDRRDEIKEDIFNGLKIYNLAIDYQIDDNTSLIFGRKINPKLSSLGAVDGLQFERSFSNFSVGAIAGSRPDWENYSFNLDLFQAGVYFNHHFNSEKFNMENTLAFVEQENNWKTDRRFLYFQHMNRITGKIYFFGSGEVDLYKKIDDKAESTFRLTNLYLSMRFRPLKKLSVSLSYSARKNVIYYETYKSYIERLIDLETLQGTMLSFVYRPFKLVSVGARAGYRSRKDDGSSSKNLYAFVSFNRLPFAGITANVSATLLETLYINGKVYAFRLSRDFIRGKLYAGLGYRNINYTYFYNELETTQNCIELNVNVRFPWELFFSGTYEITLEDEFTLNRLYFNLTKRF